MPEPETWYVLDDGSVGDPLEVAPDKSGVLRHRSGAAVKMRSPGVPHSRGVEDPDEERAKARHKHAAPPHKPEEEGEHKTRMMHPSGSAPYTTRTR